MEANLVKLDTNSKVIYSLCNIFIPYMLYIVIAANIVEDFSSSTGITVLAWGFAIFSMLVLFLFINGLFSYSNFVQIDDKYVYICKKKGGKFQVLDKIERDSIQEVKCAGAHSVKAIMNTGKVVRLLSCTPSITLMVLTAPFLCIPFILKGNATRVILNSKINELLGRADEQMLKTASTFGKQVTVINIFCWICLVLFILVGSIGILLGGCAFLYALLSLLIMLIGG